MTPPFDADRAANSELESQELGGVQFPEQEQDFAAPIDTPEEPAEEEEVEQEKPDTALSSVQQYLQDIGSVRLLSREREIELAKEVESATQQIFEALFSTPFALRRIEALAAALAAGEIELRELIAKGDDEDDEREDALDPKPFLKQVSKLSHVVRQRDRVLRALRRSRISEPMRNRLLQNDRTQLAKVFAAVKALRLSQDQIERTIAQLAGL